MMTLNRRLRQARELRGWSQAKVAEQVGTDATTVSRWERGLFSPTPYFRERLCALFGKNAEELGLLESITHPQEQEVEHLTEILYPEGTVPPTPPSWPKRTDTFKYILQSAAHDKLAHMLWEDAYVRALQGQYTQAQKLGEASLSAFEQVGHTNAAAIREWLNQRGLGSSQPPAPTPHPALAEKPRRVTHPPVRRKRVGFFLMLMILLFAAVVLSGLSFGPLHANSSSLSSSLGHTDDSTQVPLSHQTSSAHSSSTPITSPVATGVVPTAPTTTAVITSLSPTTTPGTSSPTIIIKPGQLTAHDCPLEALGYRCTLTLSLFANDQGSFTWKAQCDKVGATFNPSTGAGRAGQSIQVIVYIQSAVGQAGQLLFFFTLSAHTYTSVVSWQG